MTGGVNEDTALTLVTHEVMSHYWKEDSDELETNSVNARASFLSLSTVGGLVPSLLWVLS